MSKQPTRKRPFGVIVIVILKIFNALLLIIDMSQIPDELSGQLQSTLAGNDAAVILNSFNIALTIFLTIGFVILAWHLALIIGLWFLKRWAWFITMIQLGLSMAVGLWAYSQGIHLYGFMFLNVIMVFYLNQREIQHAFGHRPKPQQEIV